MKQLRYSRSAQQDIADIYVYIARRSESRIPAQKFAAALRSRCKELASFDGLIGRARPELGDGIRSRAFGNYLILFRYTGNILQIVRIREGHQDIGSGDVQEGD